MICPHCESNRVKKHGHILTYGQKKQRYRCLVCLKTFSDGKIGRPLVGDRPLSPRERRKRWWEGLTQEEKSAYYKRLNESRRKRLIVEKIRES
jgi:hypothetical protein